METIQGVRTKLGLVSFSHGAVRVPLAQTFNWTPKITERTLNEFDNLEPIEIVTFFEGCDVSFDTFEGDNLLVDAMFADTDPSQSVAVDDPSNYKTVNMFANMRGAETGKIIMSVLVKGAQLKGAPYTEPVLEEAKVNRDMSCLNVIKYKGAAMYYQRILANSPDASVYLQDAPIPNLNDDLYFASSASCEAISGYSGMSGFSGFSGCSGASGISGYSGYGISEFSVANAETALFVNGSYIQYVLKNGEDITSSTSLWRAESGLFAIPFAPQNTDVYEIFYLYSDT